MHKRHIFGIILGVSVGGFTASLYLLSTYNPEGSMPPGMGDMMRRMMGDGILPSMGMAAPFYLWALFPVFVAMLVIGFGGLVYYLAVPEIRPPREVQEGAPLPPPALQQDKFTTLIRTMNPDEAKVFNILASHGGKYLQKHISREAGLSRLKTHRIIVRFAARGLVEVKPFGNTNEVSLSDWLKGQGGEDKGG